MIALAAFIFSIFYSVTISYMHIMCLDHIYPQSLNRLQDIPATHLLVPSFL